MVLPSLTLRGLMVSIKPGTRHNSVWPADSPRAPSGVIHSRLVGRSAGAQPWPTHAGRGAWRGRCHRRPPCCTTRSDAAWSPGEKDRFVVGVALPLQLACPSATPAQPGPRVSRTVSRSTTSRAGTPGHRCGSARRGEARPDPATSTLLCGASGRSDTNGTTLDARPSPGRASPAARPAPPSRRPTTASGRVGQP